VAAAVAVGKQSGCRWVIFGGRGDQALATEIAKGVTSGLSGSGESRQRVINLAGQTNLRELCAALQCCQVLLTNDTGPMHLAAAVGTRVVVPYGSTSPELTGPGLPDDPRHRLLKSNVPCAPCFLRECPIDFRCMKGHGVEVVSRAVLELVQQQG
jgi:heptosyltransferase-2